MQLNTDVHVLVLPMVYEGRTTYLNLTLIVDPVNGPALVDAGLPGQLDAIGEALAGAGTRVEDLRRIVLTHQDIDHVGSLRDLVEASGARVLAHEVEAPFIDGTQTPRFARPEVLAARPEMRAVIERVRPAHVDETLRDGDVLDLAGGVRAVATPGHTVGHMCLYLERTGVLIAGDALSAADGRLQGPNPGATQDLATAAASVRALAGLDVRAIVCYHGGVVQDDAAGQLRRVADELESGPMGL
jgi:glyoxylase-like metal-dependent hydrolase (beta-lactamase superfamily II)